MARLMASLPRLIHDCGALLPCFSALARTSTALEDTACSTSYSSSRAATTTSTARPAKGKGIIAVQPRTSPASYPPPPSGLEPIRPLDVAQQSSIEMDRKRLTGDPGTPRYTGGGTHG